MFKPLVFFLIFSILLTACGGSSTNEPVELANNLMPKNSSVAIELDTIISASFGEEINRDTLTESSFTLKNSIEMAVAGKVNYDSTNKITTFTPDKPLSLNTNYLATLTSNIKDTTGSPLASTSWEFTTRDGQWQDTQDTMIAGLTRFSSSTVSFNNAGYGFSVWRNADGVWVSQYTAPNTWGVPLKISENLSSNQYYRPIIRVDESGNAVVVWFQGEYSSSIWSNNFNSESGWGSPKLIAENDSPEEVSDFDFAMDSSGNAMVIWQLKGKNRGVNSAFRIGANYYTHADGWGETKFLDYNNFAEAPRVNFDNLGNAIVVWTSSLKNNKFGIITNKFTPASGWGKNELLVSGNGIYAFDVGITANANGFSTVSWTEFNAETNKYILQFKNYSPKDGWGETELVPTDNNIILIPTIRLDAEGNILFLSTSSDVDSTFKLFVKYFSLSEGWSDVEIASTNGNAINWTQLELDESGNATAVWLQDDGIWSSRFTSINGWSTAQLLENNENEVGTLTALSTSLGKSGKTILTWMRSDNENSKLQFKWFN